MPLRARLYVGAVILSGVVVCAVAATHTDRWPAIALLALLMVACAWLSTTNFRWVDASLGLVVTVASFTLVGAAGATLVCAAGAFVYNGKRPPLVKRAFNFGQLALAGCVAGVVYVQLGGAVGVFKADSFPRTIWVILVAVFVELLLNTALTAGAIALVEHMAPTAVIRAVMVSSLSYVAYAGLGLMLAVLWIDYTPASGLLLFLPLLSARWAIRQYAEQQKAYDSTLRALITAIEVKDGYTRGHSERVSQIATMIARQARLSEERVDAVRYSALLHDVGKTGIPSSILGKHGKLTDDEFEVIKTHPARGLEMLEGIDFLQESLTGVYHHHERMDGRGYPLGLVGMEIPEIARIVMVSDAFDAMTSTRSYRPARSVDKAIDELRRCQGIQFDPVMVDALVGAVAKQGWEGDPEPFVPADPAAPAVTPASRPAGAAPEVPAARA